MWQNNFSTENRNSRPFLLAVTFFDTSSFLKHRGVPLWFFFSTVGRKRLVRRLWYSPLMHKNYLDPKPSETMEIFFKKFFETVGQKTFDGESWNPSHSYPWKIAMLEWCFLNYRRALLRSFFGIVTHWTFDRKSWYLPHLTKFFRCP